MATSWVDQLTSLYTQVTTTQNAVAVSNAQTNASVAAANAAAAQSQLQGSIAQVNAAQGAQAAANMQTYVKYGIFALLAFGAIFAIKKMRSA